MVIKNALEKAARKLIQIDNPLYEARLLLAHSTGLSRLDILTDINKELTDDEVASFMALVDRRSKGEPYAYITCEKEFMGLPFYVKEGVLIPRPDTETLVEFALSALSGKVLDIGTGSGAIAISLSKLNKNLEVHAVDISDTALAVAKKNAENLGADVTFSRLDILNDEISGEYDAIVSNPPYIRDEVIETLDTTVKDFEPHLALSGGEDGLIFYKAIANKALGALKPHGRLIFEIGYDQGEDLVKILTPHYENIKIIKDLAGNDRVVTATKKD